MQTVCILGIMDAVTVYPFSPRKQAIFPKGPSRTIQPSPKMRSLDSITILVSKERAATTTEDGSPIKRSREAGSKEGSLKLGKLATISADEKSSED
jgi:hypothetical protein